MTANIESGKYTVEGIYEGIVLPIEICDMLADFEKWGKDTLKTGREKLDAIVEKCRHHKMSDEDTRKLIDKLWKKLEYSPTHKRRLLADKYPELVHSKFANKPKEIKIEGATKMDASSMVPVVESESNSNQNLEDSHRMMDEAKNREIPQVQSQVQPQPEPQVKTQEQLPQEVKDLVIQANEEPTEPESQDFKGKTREDLKCMIRDLRRDKARQKDNLRWFEGELGRTRTELQEVREGKGYFELEGKISKLESEKRRLENENKELKKEVEALEKENTELKAKLEGIKTP